MHEALLVDQKLSSGTSIYALDLLFDKSADKNNHKEKTENFLFYL